jgi:LysM repeat protein
MNQEPSYHIDVTPEEDSWFRDIPESSSKKPFWSVFTNIKVIAVIVFAHFAGVAALFALTPGNKSQPPPPQQQPPPPAQEPVPGPSPSPTPQVPVQPLPPPLPPPVKPLPAAKPHYTTSYTVKPGDTFYGIVKRYKLNPKALAKLNNIQDTSKLKVGQVLKFIK